MQVIRVWIEGFLRGRYGYEGNRLWLLIDEQAGKLTKSDKLWLDMESDGRYCEECGVEWKGERSQAE